MLGEFSSSSNGHPLNSGTQLEELTTNNLTKRYEARGSDDHVIHGEKVVAWFLNRNFHMLKNLYPASSGNAYNDLAKSAWHTKAFQNRDIKCFSELGIGVI